MYVGLWTIRSFPVSCFTRCVVKVVFQAHSSPWRRSCCVHACIRSFTGWAKSCTDWIWYWCIVQIWFICWKWIHLWYTYCMRKLELLDGSWYVFRAYYGFPPLSNEAGQNVNAVYGFFRMLFRLWKRRPDEFMIAWDSPKKTLRKEQFEDYKANRVSMPDEFKWQMRTIKDLVEQLWIHFLEVPWYEADDIIATVVEQEIGDGSFEKAITIVSSDKDLKQLLRDGVTQFDALKNIESTAWSFLEEHNFSPILLLDYLSLVGDASDNVPGVMWIGKKWAQKLIETYWSLDEIYASLDQIQWATKQKLIDGKDSAYLSKELITLMQVPALDMSSDWSCSFDFELMHRVLVDEHKFTSLAPMIADLKKQRQWWQQYSLFW